MKQKIKLTENDLHRIIKESVKQVLKENETSHELHNLHRFLVMAAHSPIESIDDYEKRDGAYFWTVNVRGDIVYSPELYETPKAAAQACSKVLDRCNFNHIASKYNELATNESEEIVACVEGMWLDDYDDDEYYDIDTMLTNYGSGWMD